MVTLLRSLMTYFRRGDPSQRDAVAEEASEEKKLERVSSACCHVGGGGAD